ncbi:MAG: hypothetical protein N3D11_16800, partial [Candidatus Sumerlaeia bacterium]|nr:hypothetical protein [Candidatus Sumerlaeia bacterium]
MNQQAAPSPNPTPYILGLDIGPQSIGWVLLGAQQDEEGRWEPTAIERTGVRVFEAGVEGDIEQGKDESRAIDRRSARLARRRLDRLARRRVAAPRPLLPRRMGVARVVPQRLAQRRLRYRVAGVGPTPH